MHFLCNFWLVLFVVADKTYGVGIFFVVKKSDESLSSSSSEASFSSSSSEEASFSSSSSEEASSSSSEESKESSGQSDAIRLHNWGGNFKFCSQNVEYPRTTAEVQQIVRRAQKLRVFGTRHSFSKIADSCGTLLSTLGMNSIIAINGSRSTVTVQPGITYTDLAPTLCANNFALPTLAAIADISVAGATQTCAHGSGLTNSNLATQVRSMRIVLANGTEASFGPESAELRAVACGLGAFGVITEVELNLVPTFDTISYNFVSLPTESLYAHFDEMHRMGNNVLMMTTFANSSVWDRVTVTVVANSSQHRQIGNLSQLFGASLSLAPNPPQMVEVNKVQPWYYGLMNIRPGLTGKDGNELQSEYIMPYKNGVPAIKAVSSLHQQIQPLLNGFVVRTVKGDDLWLSMSNGDGPMVALHFSWAESRPTKVNAVLAQIERILIKFGARPHWGKHFTMKPSEFLKRSNYPHLNEFRKLADKLDPTYKFRNNFINENIFESEHF
ncbi:hypothetical protein niasHT_019492 [Heterodera trifolii]|uniref:FAD-binding PCMH-type domain-containing protein n=1 Tax=Heterodera trifolii TaxID=157864 RepID=A0ABD2KW62_9BILA